MDTFLTISEVSVLLRLGQRTVYELCRQGRLGGAIKIGGQWRVERTALEAWVRQGGGDLKEAPAGQIRGE